MVLSVLNFIVFISLFARKKFSRNVLILTTPKGKVIFMTLSDPYPSLRQIL